MKFLYGRKESHAGVSGTTSFRVISDSLRGVIGLIYGVFGWRVGTNPDRSDLFFGCLVEG